MLSHGNQSAERKYDVFISHASEDKEDFVRLLAQALVEEGLSVWYDEFELSIGDSLRRKIDSGLAQSSFGVVVLSPSFFQKNWTQYELDGLTVRQMSGEEVILPIWHRLTKDEILSLAPSLAGIYSLNSWSHSLEQIASEIAKKVNVAKPSPSPIPRSVPVSTQRGGHIFAVFYIAPAYTAELPSGQKPEQRFMGVTRPDGWFSMVMGDEELEYDLQGGKLRLRLDWGNRWQGDELYASEMVSNGEPFALIIRPSDAAQIYLPSVVNTSSGQWWTGSSSRSGWMVFEIQH